MPIKLEKGDQEFRNPLITQLDNKRIDLDRMLVNLFALLKYDGRRPVSIVAKQEVTVPALRNRLVATPELQEGLDVYPGLVEKWLESDIVDIVNRGLKDKQAVASIQPLHLDAYRLRNLAQTRDYNASDQVFSMLRFADPSLVATLANYFGGSVDTARVDLDTLVVWRLANSPDLADRPGTERKELFVDPLIPSAAKLLADDVHRLLAYRDVVPRHVMLEYLKTVLGIHLGLYSLRLLHTLPGWVSARRAGGICPHCQLGAQADPLMPCTYRPLLLVDMGRDFRTAMAQHSMRDVAAHFALINDFVKATFTVNQLAQYLNDDYRHQGTRATIADALGCYRDPPAMFEPTFKVRVNKLFRQLDDQRQEAERQTMTPRARARDFAQWAEVDAIRAMGLPPFETFIEVVSFVRTRFHREYMVDLLDSLLQKNDDSGLLVQGRSKSNGRRFHIGSHLLEVLVQLAVLEDSPAGGFRARPILIEDFVRWLLERYGFVINGLDAVDWSVQAGIEAPQWAVHPSVRDLEAFRGNLRGLKDQLREIGFYTDLSDAYNGQTIQPRYTLEASA